MTPEMTDPLKPESPTTAAPDSEPTTTAAPSAEPAAPTEPPSLNFMPRMQRYSRDVLIANCDPDNIPEQCYVPEGVTPCPECYICCDPRNKKEMWLLTSQQYAKYIKVK